MSNRKIAVIGAGSWGTALSLHLAEKFEQVSLWVYEKELCDILTKERENKWFLPDIFLPENIIYDNSIERAAQDQEILVLVVPTQLLRKIATQLKPFIKPNTIIINASKGIENDSLIPCHKIIEESLGTSCQIATISGPTFAKEVANKVPSALLAASESEETAKIIQEIFSSSKMKVFTSTDIMGVEIGGALKNVIAIATGICDGLNLGSNTRAALVTRGLVEIARIGTGMGAKPETFYGLSGLGDLVLTCTGDLSRNRQLGMQLGRGKSLNEITENMRMVAEGITTVKSAHQLIKKLNIQASVMEETYKVLHEGKTPQKALKDLMEVEISKEFSGIKGLA
ncbi:MAG: NAD(P)-dependent glycerol-3-phosphate dehydrogenase [Nitrospinae bacterium]|nr:NAD(P)-dependent glycerol-3-phosphate dehydrogenase [Nitrospinota bacterium]MZH06131.1 NAD(P)-dependent glycerol-3-phosphate dehydrogenase [Nitrospinota bacterium]